MAASGAALRWFRSGYGSLLAPNEKPLAFDVKEFAIAKAAVEAMLPAADGLPSGIELGIPQQIDEQLFMAPVALKADFKNGLQLLEHATLVNGHRSRFTALPLPDRSAYLDALMSGPNEALRQVAFGLKEMVHLRYYSDPKVWKAIGYDGPLVANVSPPASRLAYQQQLKGSA